jgi:small-conductance mechanosensitive channel
VVTIENDIERDASVERRLAPAFQQMSNLLEEIIRFSPLIAIALVSFLILMFIGSRFSRWQWFWERVTPNAFIAELLSTTARILFIGLGIVTALSILDATAFLGTFLGAAGVLGLAVGFAVRDTIENYIASIMLSLRQPFAPNDFVVIDGKEGRVVRLTSRATILMTMDGNHLRIPNAQVFKAVILNYTRNPLRRFDFELGVDANDDPIAAIDLGLGVLSKLDFVLADPGPGAWIKQVGDSNIVLFFCAWIDQREASFAKARSAAITAVKSALEAGGFSLPEPIYKLRFDGPPPTAEEAAGAAAPKPQPPPPRTPLETPVVDVTPKDDIERQVEEERRAEDGDLLDTTAKRE